jgi:hypothetical protein
VMLMGVTPAILFLLRGENCDRTAPETAPRF